MRLVFKNSGITAVEAMVAAAIAGGLLLSVIMIYGNITRLTAKSEAISNVASSTHLARLIFLNQSLCDNALRPLGGSGPGAHIKFTATPAAGVPNATAGQIEVYNPVTGTDGVAMATGQLLNPKVILDKIEFFEVNPGVGRSQVTVDLPPVPYNVYAGYVKLSFRATGDAVGAPTATYLAGGTPPPLQIPLTVAVGVSSGTIDYCYTSASLKDLCSVGAGGTIVTSGPNAGDCGNTILQKFEKATCPPPGPAPCLPAPGQIGIWVIDQFSNYGDDNDGFPRCNCVKVIPN